MNITKLIQARQDAVEAKLALEKDGMHRLDPVLGSSMLSVMIDAINYGFDEAIKFVEAEPSEVKKEDKMRSCRDCVYWDDFSHKQEPVQLGKCKKRAPVVIEMKLPGQWPTTEENASCGEFEKHNG